MIHIVNFRNLIILLSISLFLSSTGCSKKDLSGLGNNLTCYAAAFSKGVYKSDNGGISWYPLVKEQEDIYLYSKKLFLSPDNNRLYVTTTGGGLFFIDLEKSILNRVEEFRDEDVKSVEFTMASNGQGVGFEIFVAKKETGIYKAVEGKYNWEPFNNGLTYRDVNVLYSNAGDLYAGTINGIFKLDNPSKMWLDISGGIQNKNITAISTGPEEKTIYAGTGIYQHKKGRFKKIPSFYKSTDSGKTWVKADRGLPDGIIVFSIAVNPLKQERIYLGTSDGIYMSTDSGNKWSKTDRGLPDELRVLDIRIARVSDDKDLVYASGANGLFIALDEKKPVWDSRRYGLDETYISSILIKNF